MSDKDRIITRSAPAWAWEIIDETLLLDSQSNAFSRELRAEISRSIAAVEEVDFAQSQL